MALKKTKSLKIINLFSLENKEIFDGYEKNAFFLVNAAKSF